MSPQPAVALLAAHTAGAAAWTPASIGADLKAWYDADDAATFTLVGSAVSQWNDKSGNARHLVQGTAGAKPSRQTGVQNGRAVVRFDGGDHLRVSGSAWTTQPLGLFVVVKPNGDCIWIDANDTTAGDRCYQRLNGGVFLGFAGTEQSSTYSPTTSVHGLYVTHYNGASGILRHNAADKATGKNMGTGVQGGLTVGGNAGGTPGALIPANGEVAEIILVNNPATHQTLIETYLNTKWAIY